MPPQRKRVGGFYGNGKFLACMPPDHKLVEEMFRHEMFKMLKSEGKIDDMLIDNRMNWRQSGFDVYCGNPLWPGDRKRLENLSRYITRASLSAKLLQANCSGVFARPELFCPEALIFISHQNQTKSHALCNSKRSSNPSA